MQFSVRDDVAIAFNQGFYGALVDRFPVEASVVEGRKAILQVLAGDPFAAPDWATPVLFMRDQAKSLFTEPQKPVEEKKMSEKPANKVSIKIGNISASGGSVNVAGGDINQTVTNVTQNATPADFPKVLAEITAMVEKAGLDPDFTEEAKATLQSVEAQSKKEKPNLALITSKLKSLTELIGAAAGAEAALQQITPLIQKAVQLAQQLFQLMNKGVLSAALAYIMWGFFPIYFKILKPVSPIEILCHRMVWSFVFLTGVLTSHPAVELASTSLPKTENNSYLLWCWHHS